MSEQSPPIDFHVMLGRENHLSLSADELVAAMDDAGIGIAVARLMGEQLVWNWRAGHDLVFKAGARVRVWATANPWAGQAALDELRRCHDRGAVGLFLHPTRQGFMPIESVVEPLLNFAASVGWPVIFQTGTYVNGDVRAVGEVARRYPQTAFVLGGGGFADMWFEIPQIMAECANLYLETSLLWSDAVLELIAAGMAQRVIFASGMPRNHAACVLRGLERLQLDVTTRDLLLAGNANRILQL